ncbi:MAG: bifunctional nuclease family protein [Longimicrobiales bacterium]|nr:bifunctional nuclease family protein [Longimicrobiales bacterium]
MLVEVRVQSLGLDRSTNSPVVVLREAEGERLLPIWIGATEARAIAMQMAGMSVGRPLTHDLLVAVVRAGGGTLVRIEIPRVKQNTYYAALVLRTPQGEVHVDARPSDSIAVALRANARILADDALLDRVHLEIDGGAGEAGSSMPGSSHPPGPSPGDVEEEVSEGMSPSDLESYLRGLDPEDFGRFTP